jgi:predicted DNA-binding transcriptional regulator YafY
MSPGPKPLRLPELQLVLATLHGHGGRMRLDDLAQRCRLSRAQVVEAVDRLRMVHAGEDTGSYVDIDIEDGWVDLGPGLDQGLGRRPLPLTPGEVAALAAAIRALAEGPAAAMARQAAEVLETITGLAAPEVRDALRRIDARIAVGADAGVADPLWSLLQRSVRNRMELDLEYHTASRDDVTTRRVHPRMLFGAEGYWYLWAWCLTREDHRMFRLDRIVSARATGATFHPPSSAPELPRTLGEHVTEQDGPDLRVRFDASVADWVRERAPDRPAVAAPDGSVIVSLPWRSRTFLAGWVLSFAGKAVVLEPDDLRREIADRLAAAFPDAVVPVAGRPLASPDVPPDAPPH